MIVCHLNNMIIELNIQLAGALKEAMQIDSSEQLSIQANEKNDLK